MDWEEEVWLAEVGEIYREEGGLAGQTRMYGEHWDDLYDYEDVPSSEESSDDLKTADAGGRSDPIILPIESEEIGWQSTVNIVISHDFRIECGVPLTKKWGYFIDKNMSHIIGKYSDWVEWPEGEQTVTEDISVLNFFAFALSDNGRYLFTSLGDKKIRTSDLTNWTIVNEWESGHRAQLLAYKAGLLASVSRNWLRVWNSHSSRLLRSFSLPKTEVWDEFESSLIPNHPCSVDFSESADRIVVAIEDQSVMVFSVHTGGLLFQLECYDQIRCARFFRGYILTLDSSGMLDLKDAVNGGCVRHTVTESMSGFGEDFDGLSINSDSTLIASLGSEAVKIMSFKIVMEDGETRPILETCGKIAVAGICSCFHPSKPNILAIIDMGISVQIYDVMTGHCIWTSKSESFLHVNSIEFSPDGYYVIAMSYNGHTIISECSLE